MVTPNVYLMVLVYIDSAFYSIQENNTRMIIFREKLRFIFRGVCGRIWCWFRNLCIVVNIWGSIWLRIGYRFFTQLWKIDRINKSDIKYDMGTEIIEKLITRWFRIYLLIWSILFCAWTSVAFDILDCNRTHIYLK